MSNNSLGYGSPTVAGDLIYLGSSSQVCASYRATGVKKWTSVSSGGNITCAPAVSTGLNTWYMGSKDKKVWAFNSTTGNTSWSTATGGAATCSLVLEP